MILQDMLLIKILGNKNSVVRARAGEASTTFFFLAAHFALRNTKFGGGGKALLRLSASDGQARAGPEGETSFPYGVNKNSCFLLAP